MKLQKHSDNGNLSRVCLSNASKLPQDGVKRYFRVGVLLVKIGRTNFFLKISCFERMAIKFKNRIMFIKDTTSTEEICCWYFHGNGKKMAEVCCTSIVYTTEKKQTKVNFFPKKVLNR